MTTDQHLPNWADTELSNDLPVLRSRGENQDLEYMASFPTNTRELAKEIAAFATSNDGIILIGVSDEGELLGLDDAKTSQGRDQLLRRAEGICRGTIKPAITPRLCFAIENDNVVLVLIVPKGRQPVYYSQNIPYLRHITEARPAEPHEVLEFIRDWLPASPEREDSTSLLSGLVSDLARILTDVLIYGDEVKERMVNPWLDLWRTQYGHLSAELRELSVSEVAISNNLSDDLKELALKLDEVANFRMYLGCGEEFDLVLSDALNAARELKKKYVDSIPLSKDSLHSAVSTITKASHQLGDLAKRAEAMVAAGRVDEIQAEASGIGAHLLRFAYFSLDKIAVGLSGALQSIGHQLHLIETMRIYMDGGRSLNAIVEKVSKLNDELYHLAESVK